MPPAAIRARTDILEVCAIEDKTSVSGGFGALAPALTGCLTHIHTVPKTRPAEVVMDATLDQLLTQVDTRFNQINTLNASVEIVASEGGARQGQIKEFTALSAATFSCENLRICGFCCGCR